MTAPGRRWSDAWGFIKSELAPYPGRSWLVGRMTIAATIMMLCIMTFRLPGAALGAYYTLVISRDSSHATLDSVFTILSAIGRPSPIWVAAKTTPMPPDPITRSRR